MSRPEIYVENAIAMWASTDPMNEPVPGAVRFASPRSTRILLRRPLPPAAIAGLLAAEPSHRRIVVEDSFDTPADQASVGVVAKRMPVMIRPVGPLPSFERHGVEVVRVTTPETLRATESVIALGFPVDASEALSPGDLLPESVLALPGWTVWLACRDGVPAAGGFTYDDGVAAGVYLLATLPDYRSCGLARAIMTIALREHPERAGALVATDAGAPLYRSLGFEDVATSTWHIRTPVD